MKKTYIAPEIEKIAAMMLERLMAGSIDNSGMNDYGGSSNEGQFDEDDDNGFTPVGNSLWD